jgi:hypothetical protein
MVAICVWTESRLETFKASAPDLLNNDCCYCTNIEIEHMLQEDRPVEMHIKFYWAFLV